MTADVSPEPDPRIEAGMIEHYEDAVMYDFEYRGRSRDVHFYRRLAADHLDPGEVILELACGSGRVTTALLKAGFGVLGVDRSRPMLARARRRRMSHAHRRRLSLVCADMRELRLDRTFPLAVMAFNSFEHLYTDDDARACLGRVRAALAPGGLFAFDVQRPDLEWLARDPEERWARTEFRHPTTGEELVYSTNHIYDPETGICLIRLFYGPRIPGPGRFERTVLLSQRKYFPDDLASLVQSAGFEIISHEGGFRGEPLGGQTESQVLVCRRR